MPDKNGTRLKHALLVTAYKNVQHLLRFADALDDRFTFYIHIDKKSRVSENEIAALRAHPRIAFISRKYKVNWAGVNHLLAIIELLQAAAKDESITFFHTVSGQDYPIKPAGEIDRFFTERRNEQFIEHFAMPAGHWTNGGMHRIWHWYFFDWFDHRRKPGNFMNRGIRKLQTMAGIKRSWPKDLPPLHGGGTWWSMNRECVQYVIDYNKKHPKLLKRLRNTLCPEELFFQTIIMNSTFARSAVSDHLRYIDWTPRNGNSPADLDESDYEKIVQSGKLFARKMNYPVSEKLIEQLNARLGK